MDWEKTLDYYGNIIEKETKKLLDEIVNQARQYHPFIENIYYDIEEFVLRKGKRLASCSTLLIYKGYIGKIDEKILKVCVGIELYRHSILIHDDIVDIDDLRRGSNTLHKKFTSSYNPYNIRFGEGTAIFSGNMLCALALNEVINSGFPKKAVNNVLSVISEGYKDVNESQILDLLFEDKEVDVNEWYAMASKRAASLFKVTLLTGALLAKAPKPDLLTLNKAAKNMGYSFDIQDDIIDSFAPKDKYGRSPCLDISKNKKPLHVVYALNSKDHEISEALKCLLGKQFLNLGEIDLARKLLRESGGLEAAKNKSRHHAKLAKKLISQTNLSVDVKQFFESFIDYIEKSFAWYK